MTEDQPDLLSHIGDLGLVKWLVADLHDDLNGKVARFRQLVDISGALGSEGTLLSGGETTYAAWTEARISYIHGNYVATVLLCQGLAEHLLASQLAGMGGQELPERVSFQETLRRCVEQGIITQRDSDDLRQLMGLRNPLSHYRSINDPSNLTRRSINTMEPAERHLFSDATFSIGMAVRLLALPAFRLGK